jgi:hypothetical protein
MSATELPNAGVDLVRIHKAITRGISVSTLVSQGNGPQPALWPGFTIFLRALSVLLHAHHLGEDEVAFPFWRVKNPAAPIDQLSSEHQLMLPLLDQIDAWRRSGEAWEARDFTGLHTSLNSLGELWTRHIALEEVVMGPEKSTELLTPEENAQLTGLLSAHGQQHSQPSEIILPFVLYNLEPEVRAQFAKNFPPLIVEQLIPNAWKEAWAPMKPFLLE